MHKNPLDAFTEALLQSSQRLRAKTEQARQQVVEGDFQEEEEEDTSSPFYQTSRLDAAIVRHVTKRNQS